MVVLKEHRTDISEQDKEEMRQVLTRAANSYFGDLEWKIDTIQREVPGHLHWHARNALLNSKL